MMETCGFGDLYIETPVIESRVIGSIVGIPVFLKLDLLQPAGSFKGRGLGYACWRAVRERNCKILVCSSGGNAGFAVAQAGRILNVQVIIVVPETTPTFMREKIAFENAMVLVNGKAWLEADAKAREIALQDGAEYIAPFDHPDVWTGNSSMIAETVKQLKQKPGVIICSVGGGGLLCGVIQGLHEHGWKDVPVVAVETEGAASYLASITADKIVTIDAIRSIARSLGAARVTEQALLWSKQHTIIPCIVSDLEAVDACLRFAEDHHLLVEPACGASLAAVYIKKPELLNLKPSSILVIVCGGNMCTINELQMLKKSLST